MEIAAYSPSRRRHWPPGRETVLEWLAGRPSRCVLDARSSSPWKFWLQYNLSESRIPRLGTSGSMSGDGKRDGLVVGTPVHPRLYLRTVRKEDR